MNLERLAEEYLNRKRMLDTLSTSVDELKKQLSTAVEEQGEEDDKGHKWLQAGKYLLQRQKRQSEPTLDREAAEKWAKDNGIWDKVKVVREDLDEDALAGLAFEMRNDEEFTEAYRNLFVKKPPTWAFIQPKEETHYDY